MTLGKMNIQRGGKGPFVQRSDNSCHGLLLIRIKRINKYDDDDDDDDDDNCSVFSFLFSKNQQVGDILLESKNKNKKRVANI